MSYYCKGKQTNISVYAHVYSWIILNIYICIYLIWTNLTQFGHLFEFSEDMVLILLQKIMHKPNRKLKIGVSVAFLDASRERVYIWWRGDCVGNMMKGSDKFRHIRWLLRVQERAFHYSKAWALVWRRM